MLISFTWNKYYFFLGEGGVGGGGGGGGEHWAGETST